MRKTWIYFMLSYIIIVTFLLNCGGNPGEPEGPFVYIDDYWKEEDCCGDSKTTYFVEYHGKTPSEGGYFHLMLKENDGFPTFYGQGKIFEEGNTHFYNETLYVEIDYFDFTGTQNYTLEVEGYGNHYDKSPNTWVRDTWVIPHDSLGTAECQDCCTRIPKEIGGLAKRQYVSIDYSNDNIIEASCNIKARYGVPCGYPYSMDSLSLNSVSVSITRTLYLQNGTYTIWTQAGYLYIYDPYFFSYYYSHLNETDVFHVIYKEWYTDEFGHDLRYYFPDNQDLMPDGVYPPEEGDVWKYWVGMDTTTGELFHSINGWGLIEPRIIDTLWLTPGKRALWQNEIGIHWEDDMAGTIYDTCFISQMKIICDDDTELMPLESWEGHHRSDDDNKWFIDRPARDSIIMYDIFPNL